MMEIQQHDGVVVDVAGLVQGFAELLRERERGVAGEEGGAQGCCVLPSLLPLYIGPLGGAAAKWGGRGALPPKARGKLPLGFPTLGAWGRPKGGAPAH